MISGTPAVDAFVKTSMNDGIRFDFIQVRFSSNFKKDIKRLGEVLQRDNVPFSIRRRFLWKWELTMKMQVVDVYREEEYYKILGKIFSLASRACVHLETILLVG